MISNPFTDPKWATKTVAAIDRFVDFVSDKTTRPIANVVDPSRRGVGVLLCFVIYFCGNWCMVDAQEISEQTKLKRGKKCLQKMCVT
ncbi:MAG: hypothetical protein EBU37_03825 [Actinobacteria bacterium]|nr:hypothetical protein [Actinomycetota bacterium]